MTTSYLLHAEITSPEEMGEILGRSGAEYLIVTARGDRPWIVTSNEHGDLWAHSYLMEDEDQPYRRIDDLDYPLTLVHLADTPLRLPAVEDTRAGAVREAARSIARLYRPGLTPKATVLADLEVFADRMSRGLRADGRVAAHAVPPADAAAGPGHGPEYVRDGVCLLCGGAVLPSGEHLDEQRHAEEVERIVSGRGATTAGLTFQRSIDSDGRGNWRCDRDGCSWTHTVTGEVEESQRAGRAAFAAHTCDPDRDQTTPAPVPYDVHEREVTDLIAPRAMTLGRTPSTMRRAGTPSRRCAGEHSS